MSPANITELEPCEVFVFGSNTAGIHGKGAAKQALKWGARYGIGEGMCGRTYAIPTKSAVAGPLGPTRVGPPLPLAKVRDHVYYFLAFATQNPKITFLVTAIGCGLAEHDPRDIAGLFFECAIPNNVRLPKLFWDHAPRMKPPLRTCQGAEDGECFHQLCPQLRDCEPAKSNRSCPLPWQKRGEYAT